MSDAAMRRGRRLSPTPASSGFASNRWSEVTIPRVRVTHLPLLCQHCADAPCIKACPRTPSSGGTTASSGSIPRSAPAAGSARRRAPTTSSIMNGDLKHCAEVHRLRAPGRRGPAAALRRRLSARRHRLHRRGDCGKTPQPLEVYHPEFKTEPTVYWKGLPKPWIAGTLIDPERDEVIAGAHGHGDRPD